MSKLTFIRAFIQNGARAAFCVCAALLLLVPATARAQDRPVVVAVTYALSYFAERLAGGDAEVIFPVPEGIDPAFWRPGIADISLMQGADLIALNGAGYATWTTRASLPRARIVDTSRDFEDRFISTATVTHSHGDGGAHSHTGTASFTWLDPDLAVLQAEALAAAMTRRGVIDGDAAETRLADLTADLVALSDKGEALGPLAGGRVLVATHPRYQYLARAFGLEIAALEWDAGSAPDAAQVAELSALAETTGAGILLWEADPPAEGWQALDELGLTGVVFPTLATTPPRSDYLARFNTALDDLAKALSAADG